MIARESRSGLDHVAFRNAVCQVETCKAWRADGIAAHEQAQLPWLDGI